jgi:hypothetical protein
VFTTVFIPFSTVSRDNSEPNEFPSPKMDGFALSMIAFVRDNMPYAQETLRSRRCRLAADPRSDDLVGRID